MTDTKLHWLIIAVVGLGMALAVKDTFAETFDDCPLQAHFAGQAQHDCTVWLALKAHGGHSDLDAVRVHGIDVHYYTTECTEHACRHKLVTLTGCQLQGHLVCYGSSRYGYDRHMVIYQMTPFYE